jgi:tetratricopeptide (TPR) repeat protein
VGLIVALVAIGAIAAYRIGLGAWADYRRSGLDQALARRDWTAAQRALDDCRWASPHESELCLQAARLARRQDRLHEAERLLKECRGEGEFHVLLGFERCLLEIQSGQFGNSADLDRYADEHPESTEALLIEEAQIKGNLAAWNLPRAQQYLAIWQQRRTMTADRAAGLSWQATAALLAGNVDQATANYRQALELDVANEAARLGLARLLAHSDPAEAEGHLRHLATADPENTEVMYWQAIAARNLGQLDVAVELLDRLLARAPKHVDGLVLLGRVALDERRPADAGLWLAKAEQLAPDRHSVLLAMRDYLRMAGRPDDVARYEARLQEVIRNMRRSPESPGNKDATPLPAHPGGQ